MSTQANGRIIYELKHPFRDGTTHFVFEPLEFLTKLAALVSRPRANLTRYHGVLAPNAKYRNLVVPTPNKRVKRKRKHTAHTESKSIVDANQETDGPLAPLSWAERLKRVFKIEIELCPKCGGKLRVVATITQPDVPFELAYRAEDDAIEQGLHVGRCRGFDGMKSRCVVIESEDAI